MKLIWEADLYHDQRPSFWLSVLRGSRNSSRGLIVHAGIRHKQGTHEIVTNTAFNRPTPSFPSLLPSLLPSFSSASSLLLIQKSDQDSVWSQTLQYLPTVSKSLKESKQTRHSYHHWVPFQPHFLLACFPSYSLPTL